MMGNGMMYGYGGFGSLGLILNLVITIGVIVGIVALVIWLVRRLGTETGSTTRTAEAHSPQEILQVRYARGEITREQYQQMADDLR